MLLRVLLLAMATAFLCIAAQRATPPPSVGLVTHSNVTNTSLLSYFAGWQSPLRTYSGDEFPSRRIRLVPLSSSSVSYKHYNLTLLPPLGDSDHPPDSRLAMSRLLSTSLITSSFFGPTPLYEIRTSTASQFGQITAATMMPLSNISFQIQRMSPENVVGATLSNTDFPRVGWLTAIRVGTTNVVGAGVCNASQSIADRMRIAATICTSMGLPSLPATLLPYFGQYATFAITVSHVTPTRCTVSSYTDKLNDCKETDVYGIMCGNETVPPSALPHMALCVYLSGISTTASMSTAPSYAAHMISGTSEDDDAKRRRVFAQDGGIYYADRDVRFDEPCEMYDGKCLSCFRMLSSCGYCQSTGKCVQGSDAGPAVGSCSNWRWTSWYCSTPLAGESCAVLSAYGCSDCTSNSACAYCISSGRCVDKSSGSCDGTLTATSSFDCTFLSCRMYDGQCDSCLSSTNCGYCTTTGRCATGTSLSPSNSNDCPAATSWLYGSQLVFRCPRTAAYCQLFSSLFSCSTCTAFGCTYCPGATGSPSTCIDGDTPCGRGIAPSSRSSSECAEVESAALHGDCLECTRQSYMYCPATNLCLSQTAQSCASPVRYSSNCPTPDACRAYSTPSSGSAWSCNYCVSARGGGVCTFCSLNGACVGTSLLDLSALMGACPSANRSASPSSCPLPTQVECSAYFSCYSCISNKCAYCSTTGTCNARLPSGESLCNANARYISSCPAEYCSEFAYDCNQCVSNACVYCMSADRRKVCTNTSSHTACNTASAQTSMQCAQIDECSWFNSNCEDCLSLGSNCRYCEATRQCRRSDLGTCTSTFVAWQFQCAVKDTCRDYSTCRSCMQVVGGGCVFCLSTSSCRSASVSSAAVSECIAGGIATTLQSCPVPSGDTCAMYDLYETPAYGDCHQCADASCTYCGTMCTNNSAYCLPGSFVVTASAQCNTATCRQYDGKCARCTMELTCKFCESSQRCVHFSDSSGCATAWLASGSTACQKTVEFCSAYSDCSSCISYGCKFCASGAAGAICSPNTADAAAVCADRVVANSSSQCAVVTCSLYDGKCELCQARYCGYCATTGKCHPGAASVPSNVVCNAAAWVYLASQECPMSSSYCMRVGGVGDAADCLTCARAGCRFCMSNGVAACSHANETCAGQSATVSTQCSLIDLCSSYSWNCDACRSANSCGYCESTGRCVAGTSSGPQQGSCSLWRYTFCPTVNGCRSHSGFSGCRDCIAAFGGNVCVFCTATYTCTNLTSSWAARTCDATSRLSSNVSLCPAVTQQQCIGKSTCDSCVSIGCVYCGTTRRCNSIKYDFLCPLASRATTAGQCAVVQCSWYHGNCGRCVEQSGCGYCASTQQCLTGVRSGPLSDQCSAWQWGTAACPRSAEYCRSLFGCLQCLNYGCHFCYPVSGPVCSNTTAACGTALAATLTTSTTQPVTKLCAAVVKATGVQRIRRAVEAELGIPAYRVKPIESNDAVGAAADQLASSSLFPAACFYIDHGYQFKDSTTTAAYSPTDIMYQMLVVNQKLWAPYGLLTPTNATTMNSAFVNFTPPLRKKVNATLVTFTVGTNTTVEALMDAILRLRHLDPEDVVVVTQSTASLTTVTLRFMFRDDAIVAHAAARNGTLLPAAGSIAATEPIPEPPATSSTSEGSPMTAIIGGVVGGLLVILVVGAAIWYFKLRKPQEASELKDSSSGPTLKSLAFDAVKDIAVETTVEVLTGTMLKEHGAVEMSKLGEQQLQRHQQEEEHSALSPAEVELQDDVEL